MSWSDIISSLIGEEKSDDSGEEVVDTFRVIGLRRKPGESLVIKLYSTFTAL